MRDTCKSECLECSVVGARLHVPRVMYRRFVSQTADSKKREGSEIGTFRSLLHHLFSTTCAEQFIRYRRIPSYNNVPSNKFGELHVEITLDAEIGALQNFRRDTHRATVKLVAVDCFASFVINTLYRARPKLSASRNHPLETRNSATFSVCVAFKIRRETARFCR